MNGFKIWRKVLSKTTQLKLYVVLRQKGDSAIEQKSANWYSSCYACDIAGGGWALCKGGAPTCCCWFGVGVGASDAGS